MHYHTVRRKTLREGAADLFAWVLVALLLGVPLFRGEAAADTLKIAGTGGALGTVKALAAAFQARHPAGNIEVLPSIGSGGGIRAVQQGAVGIGLSSRPLTEDEKALNLTVRLFAKTPFVFIAHSDCTCSVLTKEQMVSIFSGKMNFWPEGGRLRLILRPPRDSDTLMIRSLSERISDALDIALQNDGLITAQTDQDAASAVESIPGAFGSSTLSLVLSEKRPVKVLAYEHQLPSVEALAENTYPLFKTFSLVTRADAGERETDFIDFVFSPAGAEVLRQTGCLPVPRAPEGR